MKKITLIIFAFTIASFTQNLARVNYDVELDKLVTSKQTLLDLQFWTSTPMVLIKNGKSHEAVATKRHNLKVEDRRIIIPAGTPCRIIKVEDSIVRMDTTRLGGAIIKIDSVKVKLPARLFTVRFDERHPSFPVMPFSTNGNSAGNVFAPQLVGGKFYVGKDFYSPDLEESGLTNLQLNKKDADAIIKASGFKF